MWKTHIPYLNQKYLNNNLLILIVLFLFLSIYTYINFFRHQAYVRIDIRSNIITNFKIYWAGENQIYSEKRSSFVRINHVQNKYAFSIPDLASIKKIRIDPADGRSRTARILIKRLIIRQTGYAPIQFANKAEFMRLIPLGGIEQIENDQRGFLVVSAGEDPKLEVQIDPQKQPGYPIEFIRILFFILLAIIFLGCVSNLSERYNHVPALMVFAFALIMIMASISKENTHPDEYVHLRAAVYYENHWLPPEVCAPETKGTHSVYGVSRLNSLETVYLIAGKFSRFLSFLPIDTYLRLRMFNVLLFFLLAWLGLRTAEFRIVIIPLLISPQIWYIFSYFNSDAFSLFLIFIISYFVLLEKSSFNRFLEEPKSKRMVVKGILFGILLCILFFTKKNFYVYGLFLSLFFLWKFYCKKFNPTTSLKTVTARLGLIILVASVFFGIRYIVDIYTNGFNKSDKILNCREKLADYIYKPSTTLKSKHPWMKLKSRGVSLEKMFTNYGWARRSFKSAFGVYGYTTIAGSNRYYDLVKLIGLFSIFFIAVSVLFKSENKENILLLIVVVCSLLLAGAAFWRSWVTILQPQGRYFFPLAAVTGFLLFYSKKDLNTTIFNTFIVIMFLVSSYSFIFVGLVNIPKY